MQRNQKLILAKISAGLAAVPLLLWAHSTGPDPGYAGVPGENGNCTSCHAGTANPSGGGVTVNFPNGLTYAPGVKQHLMVTISDSANTQRAWGFQLTARLASNAATTAGSLASSNGNTQLLCTNANFSPQTAVPFSAGGTQTCPGNQPLQYLEHNLAGVNASRGTTGSFTYEL